MKQINFLPASLRQREEQRRRIPAYGAVAVAALLLVGVFWSVWSEQEKQMSGRLAAAQAQDTERVAELQKQQQAVKADAATVTRISLINSLSKGEIDWQAVFTRIGLLVDKDVHLTTVSLASSANSVTVGVNGEAPSNVSFADFLQNLQANKDITALKVNTYAFAPTTGKVSFALGYGLPTAKVIYQRKP